MDDGGGDVELAQPGPISFNYDAPELKPFTWIDAAALCLLAVFSVGIVAGGIVLIVVREALGPDGIPGISNNDGYVMGSLGIFLGLVMMALGLVLVMTDYRGGRELEAMTRLHMVPVSRP